MKLKKSGFVSREEMEQIGTLPPGNANPVRKKLRVMKVGQIFKVDRKEWTRPGKTPYTMMMEESKKLNRKYQLLVAADDSGWFIERLE